MARNSKSKSRGNKRRSKRTFQTDSKRHDDVSRVDADYSPKRLNDETSGNLSTPPALPGMVQKWATKKLLGDEPRSWHQNHKKGWKPRELSTVDNPHEYFSEDNMANGLCETACMVLMHITQAEYDVLDLEAQIKDERMRPDPNDGRMTSKMSKDGFGDHYRKMEDNREFINSVYQNTFNRFKESKGIAE